MRTRKTIDRWDILLNTTSGLLRVASYYSYDDAHKAWSQLEGPYRIKLTRVYKPGAKPGKYKGKERLA